MSVVTLQVLERAHKEVMALARAEKGAFYDFLHKFRQNPDSPAWVPQLRGVLGTRIM